jgi:DNA-binding transcriptional MerR regulator
MLQGILIKKIMELILKQFNLDKIQKYVEEPNELDLKVKELESKITKVKTLESKIKKLEKLAHPVADFVCTKCGTKAKRVKDKLNKLKEKF